MAATRTAADAFAAASADFDALLIKLAAARAARYATTTSAVDWGDVGSFAEVNKSLAYALAFINGTAK